LRSDNGGEFTSKELINLCEDCGIKRQFSAPDTPQQNGVVERKNRIVQEFERAMLNEANLQDNFWRDLINTSFHILNRAQLIPNHEKKHYELWFHRPTSVKYFRVFVMQEHRDSQSKHGASACVFKHMTYKLDNSF
jgi:transposase InsO family protein